MTIVLYSANREAILTLFKNNLPLDCVNFLNPLAVFKSKIDSSLHVSYLAELLLLCDSVDFCR